MIKWYTWAYDSQFLKMAIITPKITKSSGKLQYQSVLFSLTVRFRAKQ